MNFAIIILDQRGAPIVRFGGSIGVDLSGLLAAGWQPVRETPLSDGGVVIVLQKAAR